MKKRIMTALIAAAMVFSLTACGSKDSGSDDSMKYIQNNKKLIMGLDDTFAPMGFRDDKGDITGFDVDLAKAVCDKLGVELVLQPVDWEAKEHELATKSIDCIWNGFSVTEERLKNLTMSIPYMDNSISLVVVKGSPITTMADMKGKKLAVQSGSSGEEALDSEANKAFKDSLGSTVGLDSYTTALLDLETGSSDAVLMDSVMANYMITEMKKDFVVLSDSLVAEEYAVGFRKGEEALCNAVNDALKELKADGTVAEISTKWFGADVTTIK